ncbi:MAG: tRNA-(ms[2]io[6]A)-hydroxylase [Mariprofundaceae bacterium]|nr:tRNA-(ms[2]io[6]A)-hydroxylase [Mariprofundaceae bacterium]
MAKKRIDLYFKTDPAWVEVATQDMAKLLADHANCERKASAMATSLIMKYRDRPAIIEPLIALAIEELEHFKQVYALMKAKNMPLREDMKDPYVKQLMKQVRLGRDEAFLDRLLICSVIETRGAERFQLLANGLEEEAMRCFYRDLWAAEARHGDLFVELALIYFDETLVNQRLHEIGQAEGDIVRDLPWASSFH